MPFKATTLDRSKPAYLLIIPYIMNSMIQLSNQLNSPHRSRRMLPLCLDTLVGTPEMISTVIVKIMFTHCSSPCDVVFFGINLCEFVGGGLISESPG